MLESLAKSSARGSAWAGRAAFPRQRPALLPPRAAPREAAGSLACPTAALTNEGAWNGPSEFLQAIVMPREVGKSSLLEMLKRRLDPVPGLVVPAVLTAGLDDLKGLSQPRGFCEVS